MLLKIRRDGDPVLRMKAKDIDTIDKKLEQLVSDMFETMYHADGVGLAAPQVGIPIRLITIDTGNCPVALINPVIVATEGEETAVEGCLSIPGVQGEVTRAYKVRVRGKTLSGREHEFEAEGLFARALQHEIDHLDGTLFIDKATNIIQQQ